MPINGNIRNLGLSVAVAALAAAGGYVAHAEQPVNAKPIPVQTAVGPVSFADIVDRVAPAVVSIEIEGKATPVSFQGPQGFGFGGGNDDDALDGLPEGLRKFFQQVPQGQQEAQPMKAAGSGFFVSSDGYVVTNGHVVEHADKITIRTADKRTLTGKLIGVDKATDLAVVKVDVKNMPFVSFEETGTPRVGDWVVAVGNPFGLGGTATAGIVSALNRQDVSGSSYVDYMQIDAPINRGNSGGPTFDMHGRVVGVNTAIYSPSGGSVGIGFDIPADVAAGVTKQLISNGKVARGFIGAQIQDVTPEIAESLGVKEEGALVADVTKDGPSEAAGLKAGDIVTRIDGKAVANATDLTRKVGAAPAGGRLKLELRRDGRPMELTLKTGVRPDEEVASNDKPAAAPPEEKTDVTGLGLSLSADPSSQGVKVAGVARNSAAGAIGIRPGDVILRAGDRDAKSADDVTKAVAAAKAAGRKQVLLLVARNGSRSFVPLDLQAGKTDNG